MRQPGGGPRGRRPAAGPADPATRALLELAAVVGVGVRSAALWRSPAGGDARTAPRAGGGGRARDDRGGPVAAGSPSGSPMSSSAARCMTGSRPCAGRSCTCRSASGWRAGHEEGDDEPARRARPPLRRGGADRRTAPGDRLLHPGRPGRAASARLRRRRRPLLGRPGARHRRRAARAADPAGARHRPVSRRPLRRRHGRVPRRPRRSPASSAIPSCWPPRRSVSRRPAGGPGSPTRARSSCCEEASRALGPGDSELRVKLLAGLSRAHAFLGTTRGARWPSARRSAWPAAWATGWGWRRCSCAPTGRTPRAACSARWRC